MNYDKAEACGNILAVIVLYKTLLTESITFQTLTTACKRSNCTVDLLVYDNSPEAQEIRHYPQWHISYVHDRLNPGVSKAYNEANKLAISKEKKWLLILDQDTTFPENSFNVINESLLTQQDIELFCPILKNGNRYISPSIYFFKRGFEPKTVKPGKSKLTGHSPVNSGIIITTKLFELSGGYNEKISLDFSDFFFINQVKRFVTYYFVMDMVCYHDLSSIEIKNNSIDNTIFRYKTYCTGAKASAIAILDYLQFFIITLLRGVHLAIKFRNLVFFKIFYNSFVKSLSN